MKGRREVKIRERNKKSVSIGDLMERKPSNKYVKLFLLSSLLFLSEDETNTERAFKPVCVLLKASIIIPGSVGNGGETKAPVILEACEKC